ncbi:alpha/beta hydrolase [Clostridiales bacterium COT073_COT-073]|nr:alpha/beta hydrolase [Clostridiales bacterium COT073_COT-073]
MVFEYQENQIYYEEIGEGTPILLIHGLGAEMGLMKACMEPVFHNVSGYRRIYLDLPGMGKSNAVCSWASSDGVLEVLTAFVREVIKTDFLVAGQSYGGYLARGILRNFPEKVLGMALICPVAIAWHKDRKLPVTDFKVIDKDVLKELDPKMQADLCRSFVRLNKETYRLVQEIMDSFGKENTQFVEELVKQYAYSFDVDAEIKKMDYQKPVLFLTGKQDTVTGYADVWEIAKDYARATFTVIDIAGHALQIDQKELFEVMIREWLERAAE